MFIIMNRIAVVGAGYVGLSIETMLSINNKVTILDIDEQKINAINNRKSPIVDDRINYFFYNYELNLKATKELSEALDNSNIVI